jgi:hypothetical protein
LPGIDDQFWDWLLWLSAKQEAAQHDLVAAELARLHLHLLDPLGVITAPAALAVAVASYLAAWELGTPAGLPVSRAAQHAVSPALP